MYDFIKKIFGCNHIYSEVKPDGYQYCKLCGKSYLAPIHEKCFHIWDEEKVLTVSNRNDYITKYIYVLRCKKCGDMKKEEYGI